MKTLPSIFAVLIVLLTATSCMITGVVGSKNLTTETRSFDADFSGIKVSQGIEVELTQNDAVSFEVEMDDNLHEHLVAEVQDGILKIHFDTNIRKRKASIIYLSMPTIHSVKTSSGAEVNSTDIIQTDNLTIDASSGSEVFMHVNANSIETESSSGSHIELKGNSETFTADSSSGSNIDAANLKAKHVEAEVSSGADIEVFASESFKAKASSGGSVNCDGNPSDKSIKKTSGGKVRVD